MSRVVIPKNVSQEIIDHLYSLGYEKGLRQNEKEVLQKHYARIWTNGLRQAIRLRPQYYRPHNENANSILDPYLERIQKSLKNPPKPNGYMWKDKPTTPTTEKGAK